MDLLCVLVVCVGVSSFFWFCVCCGVFIVVVCVVFCVCLFCFIVFDYVGCVFVVVWWFM